MQSYETRATYQELPVEKLRGQLQSQLMLSGMTESEATDTVGMFDKKIVIELLELENELANQEKVALMSKPELYPLP